jgi:4-carboxymuconolactone decarboxylase
VLPEAKLYHLDGDCMLKSSGGRDCTDTSIADGERDSDYRAPALLGTLFCVLLRVRGGIRMDERQRYEQGMKTRRSVLGDAHVDATLKNRNEFTEAFQDIITRYAWGEIWSRPGLPRDTRSMLTLAMMVALNRPDELRMHLRAALTMGVTREQIQEVLLQSAIYCGLPAANSAFHMAMEVIAEHKP